MAGRWEDIPGFYLCLGMEAMQRKTSQWPGSNERPEKERCRLREGVILLHFSLYRRLTYNPEHSKKPVSNNYSRPAIKFLTDLKL